MTVEHREIVSGPALLVRQQYRVVCDCGYRTRWVLGHWHAEDKQAAHDEACPRRRFPVQVGSFEPDSPEWHAARAHGLGGSEIAAVLGLSPYESHFSLWHRKAGRLTDERDNAEMRAGRLLEPVIIEQFRSKHPDWGLRKIAGTWRHRDRPWQLCNPDALLSIGDRQGALLEAKFSLYADGFGAPGTDEIPVYYDCQVQWYLDVFSLERAYLNLFVGSSARFCEYVIDADPVKQARLREAGEAFMASIAADERPPIDGHDRTYEVIRELHPDIDGGDFAVPAALAEGFCRAKHAEKAAEVEAKRWTGLLADAMGSAATAKYAGHTIARRQSKGGGTPYVVAGRGLPFGEDKQLLEAS